MKNQSLELGYYAHYPSILEPSPGPWGGLEIYDMHPVDAWKRILAWLKSKDVDYLIAVVSPKYRDSIMHDFPFLYLLDFEPYPEARTFPSEIVEENRRIVREVIAEAKRLGIDFYFNTFNFYAPRGFVEARPRLLENYRRSRNQLIGHDEASILGTLWGNISWPDPEYREFLRYCYRELFNQFPEATGMMTAGAEHIYDVSPQSVGTGAPKESRTGARREMVLDYLRFFTDEMQAMGKKSFVRTWYVGDKAEGNWPKPDAMVQKFHVFDCLDAGMCPDNKKLWDLGIPCHQALVHNAENAAQLIWFSPSYWRRVGRELRDHGVPGAWIHDNTDWGNVGMRTPMQGWNLEAYLHYARQPEDGLEEPWLARSKDVFGPDAATVALTALEDISHFVLNISKVIYFSGEGYTWNCPLPVDEQFHPDPWALVGGANNTPPEWVRGNLQTVKHYVEEAATQSWQGLDLLMEKNTSSGKECPLSLLRTSIQRASAAADSLKAWRSKIPTSARNHWEAMITSAHAARCMASHIERLIVARLLITAMRNPLNAGDAAGIGWQAVRAHGEAIKALREVVAWLNNYPHDMLDTRVWFRLRRPLFSRYYACQWTPLDVIEEEHQNLLWFVRELDPSRDEFASDPAREFASISGRPLPAPVERGFKMREES
jgi:hypothetical protein